MKYDVFISYSSLDQKVAEGVCAYLEQHRIRCFIAYRDIPRGVEWAEVIPQALLECRVMVIIFSDNFNASEEVNREITIAVKSKKIILPFRISDDDFKGLKLYYLCGLNWIDAFPNPEKSFGSLCESVQKLLEIADIEQPIQEEGKEVDEGNVVSANNSAGDDLSEQCLLKKEESEPNGEEKNWPHKAAEKGNAMAQYELGLCYKNGRGVVTDSKQAVYWFRKAAEQGYAMAQYDLGRCYQKFIGVSQDLKQAVYWFHEAAEQGHVEAQFCLGHCYYNGSGIKQDFHQAVYWYQKAAEQGHTTAQYNLGVCYQCGVVAQDLRLAVYWFRKAAQQGNRDAQETLKELGETW